MNASSAFGRATMGILPRRLTKQDIKGAAKKLKLHIVRRVYRFDGQDLMASLRDRGLSEGSIVVVHSAFGKFSAFDGTASDVVSSLQSVVGPGGTILMPTMPFTGSAVDYARANRVFDVRRTPSRMGLITEIFRRSPGVLRSVHPTHSVAAWGAEAEALLRDHHRSKTPCGAGTPYIRMAERNGQILLLGTDIRSMTYFHGLEEELEDQMPWSPFTDETFVMLSKDSSGNTVETRNRLFDPALSRRRNLRKLEPVLKSRGIWREGRVGNLTFILLKAEDVAAACRDMADRGEFCYDEPDAR